MSGPQQVFEEFVREYRGQGEADPRPYLARVEGVDRAELQALIEAFLERAPRRRWDPDAFPGSLAERALARAGAEEEGAAERPAGWPSLLPALRNRAQLTRRVVVERLAVALGFPDQQQRVAAYYHRMERGLLRPSGVSDRVLEALAEIVGTSAEALRRAGAAGQRAAEAGGEVFARVGAPKDGAPAPAEGEKAPPQERPGPPDELDRLFTGDDDVQPAG